MPAATIETKIVTLVGKGETYTPNTAAAAPAAAICAHWPSENEPRRSLASKCLYVGCRTAYAAPAPLAAVPAAPPPNRPETPSAPAPPPARRAARPYTRPRAAVFPSEGVRLASIACRARSCGALNDTNRAATATQGLTSSVPNEPVSVKADAPITANSAKHRAHTTGHSNTPISDCSHVRASHDVSGSGHSAIASGAATNRSASSVARTIFVTISRRKITTATTAAIVPTPSGVKLAIVAAPSSFVRPDSTPGACVIPYVRWF